jgi:hypothetical protein
VEVETNFAVDTLRFPDAERRRIAESLFRPERTEDQLMKDDVLRNMLETVDAVFSITAEETADRENISLEDAREGMWALFEAGFIRLVSHSDSMGIEPCLSRNERRAGREEEQVAGQLPEVHRRRRVRSRREAPYVGVGRDIATGWSGSRSRSWCDAAI